jgi:hypothetical protein
VCRGCVRGEEGGGVQTSREKLRMQQEQQTKEPPMHRPQLQTARVSCTLTRPLAHTRVRLGTHTLSLTHTHTHARARTHTHTHIHTHTHTRPHTHTHTHTPAASAKSHVHNHVAVCAHKEGRWGNAPRDSPHERSLAVGSSSSLSA